MILLQKTKWLYGTKGNSLLSLRCAKRNRRAIETQFFQQCCSFGQGWYFQHPLWQQSIPLECQQPSSVPQVGAKLPNRSTRDACQLGDAPLPKARQDRPIPKTRRQMSGCAAG